MSVPLTRFQVFDTHDPDELGAWLNGLLGRATLDLHTRNTQFHSRISHLALGDVRIIHNGVVLFVDRVDCCHVTALLIPRDAIRIGEV